MTRSPLFRGHFQRLWAGFLGLAMLGCLTGCLNTYEKDIGPAISAYRDGDFPRAASALGTDARRNQDQLIWLLERGKALQDNGEYQASAEVFIEAEARIEKFFQTATMRVTQETAAAVLNQYTRAYEPTFTDAIMVNVLQARNYLAMGNLQEARVYLRKAYNRQTLLWETHRKYIEKKKAEIDEAYSKIDDENYRQTSEYAKRATPDFGNPIGTYLWAVTARIAGDQTDASVPLRQVQEMVPGNPYVESAMFERLADAAAGRGTPQVIVLVETGLAPKREATKIPYATPYTGVSVLTLPRLGFEPEPSAGLRFPVEAAASAPHPGKQTVQALPLASLNAMIAAEFKARLPVLVLRAATELATKEAMSAAAHDGYGAPALIGTSLYKLATSQVDDRAWRTLPAQVQVAQFDRPATGQINLNPAGGVTPSSVIELPDAGVTVLWVRQIAGHLQGDAFAVGPPPARR